jgi:hypothetical protein
VVVVAAVIRAAYCSEMIRLDLTDAEFDDLVEVLRDTVEADRYRMTPLPRIQRLRRLLEKIEQSRPALNPPTWPTRRRQ